MPSRCPASFICNVQPHSAHALFYRVRQGLLVCAFLILAGFAKAQSQGARLSAFTKHGESPHVSSVVLQDLNSSIQSVVAKASAAVVQIMVAGYGPEKENSRDSRTRVVRQHAIGSGIIVDPDGYILTNAHVVEGALRIRVILPPQPVDSPLHLQPTRSGQILEAKLLGRHKDSDIALLKVDAKNLPSLPLRADVPVHQGELVFAIGSPEGLQDSVTMGIVSAVTRQVDPNDPMVYIQTDAAVNPGNSGGPLLDVDGNVVGMNTMMLSTAGGSEGLGFAIPAAIVNFDYQRLRQYGRVQRVTMGVSAQDITPTLAAALGLPRSWGTIISDVTAGGPEEAAGLQPGDIVLTIDGRPIRGLPDLVAALYLHPPTEVLSVDVLRGNQPISFNVAVMLEHDKLGDVADVPVDQQTLVPRLGILVADLNESTAPLVHVTAGDPGIVVVGLTTGPNASMTGLSAGDVIRSINRAPIQSVSQLRTVLHNVNPGDPVAIQVERDGRLQYLAFEME